MEPKGESHIEMCLPLDLAPELLESNLQLHILFLKDVYCLVFNNKGWGLRHHLIFLHLMTSEPTGKFSWNLI